MYVIILTLIALPAVAQTTATPDTTIVAVFWHEMVATASAAGKLNVFNWGPSLTEPHFLSRFIKDPTILWIAVLNGFR